MSIFYCWTKRKTIYTHFWKLFWLVLLKESILRDRDQPCFSRHQKTAVEGFQSCWHSEQQLGPEEQLQPAAAAVEHEGAELQTPVATGQAAMPASAVELEQQPRLAGQLADQSRNNGDNDYNSNQPSACLCELFFSSTKRILTHFLLRCFRWSRLDWFEHHNCCKSMVPPPHPHQRQPTCARFHLDGYFDPFPLLQCPFSSACPSHLREEQHGHCRWLVWAACRHPLRRTSLEE